MSLPVELYSAIDKKTGSTYTSISTPATTDSGAADDTLWKKELAGAITSATKLLDRLALNDYIDLIDTQSDFKCLATKSFINKMEAGNINDPLLQQVLPTATESESPLQTNGISNPVGDIEAIASPGLLHKYNGRALLISTAACAIHCRYCFRRHYPYQQYSFSNKTLDQVLNYLGNNTGIEEIILSGGDPLMLDNEKLAELINKLETISHLHTLRIHTRLPVVLPNRINAGLIAILSASRFQVVMVIHANHANELGEIERERLLLMDKAGITLLNQSVLLKGINDQADTLIKLSKRLFSCKTLPYYLHMLDPVKGAMHFEVTRKTALNLKTQMEEALPGYLVPKLVQELAGNKSKTAIFCI